MQFNANAFHPVSIAFEISKLADITLNNTGPAAVKYSFGLASSVAYSEQLPNEWFLKPTSLILF